MIKYYLSILWHRIRYGFHSVNADLASERLDWDAYARAKGKADEARRKWKSMRYERMNRKAIAYYQSIRDQQS